MNTEDDEFNRVEREAKQRKEAVLQALHNENQRLGLYKGVYEPPFNPDWNNFHDGVAVGRTTAFEEIGRKIKAMPFNDDTIDSLLTWLKEQE